MNSKLTLTIDKTVIENAKQYAKLKGRSLSDLIENYLKMISEQEVETPTEFSPIVASLKGSFKEPVNFDYKENLTEALIEKYIE